MESAGGRRLPEAPRAIGRFVGGAGIALVLLAAFRAGRVFHGPSLSDIELPALAFLIAFLVGALRFPSRARGAADVLPLLLWAVLVLLAPELARFHPAASPLPGAFFALSAIAGGLALGARSGRPGWASAAGLLGACAGVFAGSHLLIPVFGDRGASLGALLAFAALLVLPRGAPAAPSPARPAEIPGTPARSPGLALASASLALAAASLALAVLAWGRLLDLLLGPTLRTTGLSLSMLLLGLACGAFGARGREGRVPRAATAVLLAGIFGAFHLVLIGDSANLPYLFVRLVRPDPGDPLLALRARAILAALTVFPGALAGGALLGRIMALLGAAGEERTSRASAVSFAAGLLLALAAGPRLFPLAGIRGVLLASVGLSALCGALLLFVAPRGRRVARVLLGAALAVLLLLAVLNPPRWRPGMLNTGPYLYAGLYADIDEEGFRKTYSLLPSFYREGMRETVLVAGASGNRLLITNGAVESSDRAYRPTQVLLARLPMLFRPEARTAYACGSGVGITAGTLLGAGIDTLVCVEPERARLEAMHHFASVSGEPWSDPRARFPVGEPRRALARENPRFDVIVCGSARPSDRNAAHLDTKEFYAVAASRLRPGGIASASFPLAGIREDHLLSLLAAFRAAFPHVLVFESPAGDALLALGSGEPLQVNVRDLLRLSGDVTADADLRESDLRSVHDLAARALLDGEALDVVSAASRPNRDGSSFVESGSELHPRGLLGERNSAVLRSARFDPDRFLEYDGLSREERGAFRLEAARAFLRAWYAPGGLRYAERAFEDDPTGPASSLYAHLLRREVGDLDSAIAIVRAAWERDRHDPSLLRQLGDYLFFARRYAECDSLLTEAIEDGVTDAWCYVERGKARLGLEQYDSALQDLLLGKDLDRLQDNSGDINYFIGMAYKNLGKLPESKDYLSRAIERSPRHLYARLEYGESRALLGEIGRVEFDSGFAVPFNRARAETLFDRAVSRLYEPDRAEEVERDLNAVVNTTPRHFGAYLALAEFYHRNGKPEKEREVLGEMVARLGSPPELRKHLRDYLRRTGGEERVRGYRDLIR